MPKIKKQTTPTKKQISDWKRKAEKWDKLDAEIAAFYPEEGEDEGNGDLTDIGEIAARAFGWL